MAHGTRAGTPTWTYVDGDWIEGNPPLIGPVSHAMWLASTVFDGARWFEGVSPDLDLHCQRVNRSARALGLEATVPAEQIEALVADGVKKFDGKTAIYVKPMYWAEHGGYMGVPADPASTRFCLCLFESPMIAPSGFSLTLSPFRRPSLETAPTDAKAGCLYPNSGRAIREAQARGFDNALMLDMVGNVAETATSNIFMVKDGVVFTPVPNGSFLSGITRHRAMTLMRADGRQVVEKSLTMADFRDADEIFATGNHSKVVPVIRFEERDLQPGPVAHAVRDLYMDWAHSA
ncbi:branched-chain amino acid aminotransferase [Pseudohoeflea coraliihabitans]|uniref:Branched-chain amino acid aminotransferase n=1 Tax=Pseudohoeflea coraliihabitans TaxID=2860393 RepID=A0ABS6WRR4_9HYPH|nr:branched-chain amino acid aminotransferase [Pseudohoeflea sp. DP4N28-3]MBW3098621.1 branched-chain amino acid aminotransferase [Pseudohoeflea sp. DP4N28-3]